MNSIRNNQKKFFDSGTPLPPKAEVLISFRPIIYHTQFHSQDITFEQAAKLCQFEEPTGPMLSQVSLPSRQSSKRIEVR